MRAKNFIIGLFILVALSSVVIFWNSHIKEILLGTTQKVSEAQNVSSNGLAELLEKTAEIDARHQLIEDNALQMEQVAASVTQLQDANSGLNQSQDSLKLLEETLAAAEIASEQLSSPNLSQLQNSIDEPVMPSIEEVEQLYQEYREQQLGVAKDEKSVNITEYIMPPEVLETVENSTGITGAEIQELMNR